MVITHDRVMVDEAHGSKNGNEEEDCDDNNCGVDQFTSLFLCPDPILSDSPTGGAHLIFSEGGTILEIPIHWSLGG